MNVAIIPARGGSKRIPGKNIRHFLGAPIIQYSIEAALKSPCIQRVVVSTDSEEIAHCAEQQGAEVPFIRPASLADDYTDTNAVIQHALMQLLKEGKPIDYACCLYATAPFVTTAHIDAGYRLLVSKSWDYTFPVTDFEYPIQRALKIHHDHSVDMFQPEYWSVRSQDLDEAFHDVGQFYWGRCQAWLEKRPIFSPASGVLKIPREWAQDIDTEQDWKIAEMRYQQLSQPHQQKSDTAWH